MVLLNQSKFQFIRKFILISMKKQQSMIHPLLKKHHRIKSQQIVSVSSQNQTVLKQALNKPYPHPRCFQSTYHLAQISQPSTGEVVKIAIESKTDMKRVKQLLCIKLGVNANDVYFYSLRQDQNFDYCLAEGIGKLQKDIKLGYAVVCCERDQKGNLIESGEISNYFIYDCLSVGGFSKVFLVRSKKSGKFYAAKFVDKNFDSSQKFKDLIYNQKYINEILDYQLLVKMHKFIQTQSFYIFILDYCPSGELFCLMKSHREMSEQQAKFYFIQTVLAIQYIHSQSIIYRDIKPENILLDKNGHVKLADFGLSKVMREKSTSYCGSLQYMAPEIVLGVQHSFGVDHYCLGSLLFEIMIGCPPFYNPNFTNAQTKYHIVNSQVKFPSNRKLSDQLIDLITRLLDKNPKTRLGSLGGIKEIFAHPWVGKFNRKKYENYQIEAPYRISLNKSNFETAFLPKQAIEQVKLRLQKQIDEKNKISSAFNKTKKHEEIETSPLKFTPTLSKYSTSYSRNKKSEIQNPYQMLMVGNKYQKKKSVRSSKLIIKSQSKTFHIESNFAHKNRSLTRNAQKSGRFSQTNEANDVFAKKQGLKQNLIQSYLSKQNNKRSHNTMLHRKSGNSEKENALKLKFQKKSKQVRELLSKNLRSSVNQENQDQEKMSIKKEINRRTSTKVNIR